METKEYIVVLNKDVDYDQFWSDIESPTSGLPHIPDRAVDIANNRTLLERICEYHLTDEEAELLKNDSRVLAVEIPVRNNPNVFVSTSTTQNPSTVGMNFSKLPGNVYANYTTGTGNLFTPTEFYTYPGNASINWGLVRHSVQSNPYGSNPNGITNLTTTENYNYVLNGNNVDIIINDTGIQANHPEFAGRIANVNWNSIAATVGANTSFNWNTASYTDTEGHGTNVAGIAAGETYGWAKGANIIPLCLNFSGQSSAEPLDMFEMMIYWHQNKGTTNPTVVNMSWDIRFNFSSPYNQGMSYCNYYFSSGSYRGTTWSRGVGQPDSFYQTKGLIALTRNGWPGQGSVLQLRFPYSSAAYNAALGHVIDAGIVVCQSAGNNGFKIDTIGGDDYNNYVVNNGITYYYHRGASPKDPRAIVVGALDTKTSVSLQDQRAQYSCAGPGVDIWAAGTFITSAGSNTSPLEDTTPYYLNKNFKESVSSGTSQATPQVTGICALYLQDHRPADIYNANNCSSVKSWLTTNATTNTFYSTGNATSYTDGMSLLGGEPKVAYQPIQGLMQVKNNSGTWQSVADVSVRGVSSWEPVKAVWTKTDSGWTQVY